MSYRTFHVELTFYKTIEVKVASDDVPDGDDIEEWVIDEALLTSFDSKSVVTEDYEVETVKEVSGQPA